MTSKRSKFGLQPDNTYPPTGQTARRPGHHPQTFFRKYFWLFAVLALALFLLAFADRYYVTTWGLGVQQGLITAKTVQSAVLCTAGLLITLKLYAITIRARDKFKGGYRSFYYFSFLNWPAAVLLILTLFFQTPQQTFDLFHYWNSGSFAEYATRITGSSKSCDADSSSCTLVVDTSDQGRFRVNGYMSRLILAQETEVNAIRYLPHSRKIINLRTAEGWQ